MEIIKLKNNPNIRDIGGKYKNVTIKKGMLIRGRTLRKLTEEQQLILTDEHHVKTIIDLRSHDEAEKAPELVIPKTNYEIMPIFEREKDGVSHNENEKVDKLQVYRKLPTMDRIYFNMLHDESLANMGKVINRIITAKEDEFAFYFHCSEGKDRTGLVAAILLSILGVSRPEIEKEYLITNKTSKRKAFRYYLGIKYLKFDPVFALKVGRAFLAKRKYIRVLFAVIDEEYKTLDKFLTKGLNLNLEDVNKFRDLLIEK